MVKDINSPMARRRVFRLPVIRGVIALGESLAIGFRALAISANYAARNRREGGRGPDRDHARRVLFSFAIAIGFALMLFKVTPALITNWSRSTRRLVRGDRRGDPRRDLPPLPPADSLLPDLRRVPVPPPSTRRSTPSRRRRLTPERVQYSLIHPRCGTAFLLWVGDRHLRLRLRRPTRLVRLILSRILLLPVIAGIAYELIRFAGKHQDNAILR